MSDPSPTSEPGLGTDPSPAAGDPGGPGDVVRLVLESSADILGIIRSDGSLAYVTPSVEQLTGYQRDHFQHRSVLEVVHPDDVGAVVAELHGTGPPGEGGTSAVRFRVRTADGHWRWLDARSGPSPTPGRHVFSARDVTEEVAALEALAASEERYRHLVERSPQAIGIYQDDRLVYVNPAARRLIGAPETGPFEVEVGRLVDRGGGPDGEVPVFPEGVEVVEVPLTRLDGTVIQVELTRLETSWMNRPAVQVVATDVTARRRAEAELAHQATHDHLTGLPNRLQLTRQLEAAIAAGRGGRRLGAVLFCDFDRFKVINDALGHPTGDKVIVTLADRVASVLRPGDTIARFGGDELVVVATGLARPDDAGTIAERILATVAEPVVVDGHTLHLTASVGVVLIDGDADPDGLLRDADTAMYAAKAAGRNQWRRFDGRAGRHAANRLRIEQELRRALVDGELVVHLQPEVDLAGGRVLGYEALVRWRHPTDGLLLPARFLPVAADAGLLSEIGQVVLRLATAEAAGWTGPAAGCWVAVNVSPQELRHPGFTSVVAAALGDSGLEPWRLCLELTEDSILADPAGVARALAPLRDLGVQLAIDDFGTGFSSLSHLTRFAPEFVKIDRSFIAALARSGRDRAIVESVVRLAGTLGITAVAEGIEDPVTAEDLRRMGCPVGQGWLFGRPGPLARPVPDRAGNSRGRRADSAR
jgi:diguanylate cyclase (GGDEF)-like protein/PAS domain S-box-containing protein